MLAKHFYGLGEASLYVVKTRPFCKKGLVTVTYNTYNILLPYYQLYVFVLSIRSIHYTRDGQIWYTRGNTVLSILIHIYINI